MAKNPAFRLYASDFLTGVSDLTMEERGQYITLLCLQHQKGHLSEKVMRMQCHGIPTADVMAKFRQDPDGLWYNKRLDEVIAKADEYSRKQSDRAKKRWENTNNDATADATAYPRECLYDNDTDIDNDIEKDNEIKVWPTFEDFWEAYDKKTDSKKKVEKKWESLKQKTKEAIMEHVPEYVASTPDKAFRKNPSTYLNQEGWTHEIINNNGGKKKGFTSFAAEQLRNDPDYKTM